MPVTFYKELNKLSRAKKIVALLPQRMRLRVAKMLYDYESGDINGIDLVAPLQNEGLVCFINTKDLIGWKIFFLGEYEKGTNKTLAKYIKKGDVVIEAGANLGSETILLSKLVGEGKVYGFEPNPYTFERLSINVTINDLKNVKVYDIAIGEKNGDISFNIYPKGFCNPGMSSKYMETPLTTKITVQQKTLDTFVQEQGITKLDFLKMDIQGAEMDLLNGASATISKYKPTIFLEALALFNDTKALYVKFRAYGYNVYIIEENGLKPIANTAAVQDGNWLAIHEPNKATMK